MEFVQLLPLLLIVLLFWVMVVRPASRRQKDLVRLQESLQTGQQVMLASGMFGTIRSLTEDRALVEVAAGVQVEVVRGAISKVVEPSTAEGSADGPADSDPSGATGHQP